MAVPPHPHRKRIQPSGNGWIADLSTTGRCFLHIQPNGLVKDMSGAEVVRSDLNIAFMMLNEIGETAVAKKLHGDNGLRL